MNVTTESQISGIDAPAKIQPSVTVIMPAYNAAATIEDAINSVLQQSFSNFELLIIDDGSSDNTIQIVAGITDSRIRVLSFDNKGPAASRNRGIRRAAGQLIAFLDSDDLWTPDKLDRQVEALRKFPDAALVYSWTDCIDECGHFLRHGSHLCHQGNVYEPLLARNFIDTGSAPMVRKQAVEQVGLFDEEYRIGEDWDLWLRLADQYSFACVPSVQVLYRVRSDSLMTDAKQVLECVNTVLEKGLERLPASTDRERIRRTATANIYKYLSVRLVETGTLRQDGIQAGRYLWSFITTTPKPIRQLGKSFVIGCAVIAMIILPPAMFASLRESARSPRRISASP